MPNPLNVTPCLRPQLRPCRPLSSEASAVDSSTGLLGATILPTDERWQVVWHSACWTQQMAEPYDVTSASTLVEERRLSWFETNWVIQWNGSWDACKEEHEEDKGQEQKGQALLRRTHAAQGRKAAAYMHSHERLTCLEQKGQGCSSMHSHERLTLLGAEGPGVQLLRSPRRTHAARTFSSSRRAGDCRSS